MMGEASEAVALHAGGNGGAAAGGSESGSTWSASSGIGTASSGSSSFFSSTSSVGDEEEDGDGATSSRPAADRHFSSLSSLSSSSSTSSESEALQMNGAAGGGPLYGMSTMRDHLPPALSRTGTGLSKYYQGRSESFTSLADVSCLEDLVKKTIPYIRRPKAPSRRHTATLGVKNRLSKTGAKKAPSGRKPAGASECQGKRELYRC